MRLKDKARLYGTALLVSSYVIFLYGIVSASSSGLGSAQQPTAQTGTPRQAVQEDSSQSLRLRQTQEEADAKSLGCQSCHTATDSRTMHLTQTVRLGCTDCHGGDATVQVAEGL